MNVYWNGNAIPEAQIEVENVTLTLDDVMELLLNYKDSDNDECNSVAIDDFAMWNRTLTHDEVISLRASKFCTEGASK